MYKDKQEYKKFIEDMENTKFASVSSKMLHFYKNISKTPAYASNTIIAQTTETVLTLA